MDNENSIKHSIIIKEILSVKVKDPTIFECKGTEYTNYKIQTLVKDYQEKIKKVIVFHRYTDFSNFKNEIESNLNKKLELINQFPSKPSKIFAYGQFTSNHVEERSKKFNDWLNELISKSKDEYKEIESNLFKFLLEGESEDKTNSSLEIKLSDPLYFKKDPESSIEINKLPLVELKDSEYWYNLITYKILSVEALNKSHIMNYLSTQSYRLVFKTSEGKFFQLAQSTNKNFVLTFFSRLKKLIFTTLNLSKEQSVFFLPDIIDFIHKQWEIIKKEGYNFLEFKKKINQAKDLFMFEFPREFVLSNVESLHPGLVCPICKKIATKPIKNVVSLDESIYCKKCLLPKMYKDLVDNHLSSEDEQISAESFFSKIKIEFRSCALEKITTINNLSVHCPFKKFGCKIVLKNEDVCLHAKTCANKKFSCQNKNCTFTSNDTSLMLEHLRICEKGFFNFNKK